MPFTPLHMGPAILFKALQPERFSLVVFGWAQILMDLQPLIAVAAALSGRYLGTLGLSLIGLHPYLPISWRAAWLGAAVGTLCHVLLDSIVHADMQPLAPISPVNGLFGLLSWEGMEWLCLAGGALGSVLLLLRARLRPTTSD